MNWGLKHSRRVKEGCEMAVLSLRHHLSSCWKCNTYDSVAHISWRYIKMSQLCGSFIKPANVILITSSISTHMSQTNAGTECFFFLFLFSSLLPHCVSHWLLPHNLFLTCISSFFLFLLFSLPHLNLARVFCMKCTHQHTHMAGGRNPSTKKKKKWPWGVKLCVCTHAGCLTSAYVLRARRQLGPAWITARSLCHCSSDTPLLHVQKHISSLSPFSP